MMGRTLVGALGAAALLVGASASAATLTVYESRAADGSTMLSDRPLGGARAVTSHRYEYTPVSREVLDAERSYWRGQSEAFQRRQLAASRLERQAPPRPASGDADPDGHYHPYWTAYGHGAGRSLVPIHQVPRTYSSSPGAVRGRDGGFIGSGFSTAR